MGLDEWQEFGNQEIAVAIMAIGGVDKETPASLRRNHEEVPDFMFTLEVFDQSPSAAAHERLLVLSQAMQEVKHWILLVFFLVIVRR